MPSLDRPDPVVLGHLLVQHRDLHMLVQGVREALEPPRQTGGLRAAVVALREHLAEHFAQEERGGFMEEAISRMPRLSTAVAHVLRDHPQLLAELDHLIECLPVSDSASAWATTAGDFSAFAAHLSAHERNENAVVQEGYNEDLGLVD